MTIQLDHLMIPAKHKAAAAECLARILGVPWAQATVGSFAAVFVSDSLTIDFDERGVSYARRSAAGAA